MVAILVPINKNLIFLVRLSFYFIFFSRNRKYIPQFFLFFFYFLYIRIDIKEKKDNLRKKQNNIKPQ